MAGCHCLCHCCRLHPGKDEQGARSRVRKAASERVTQRMLPPPPWTALAHLQALLAPLELASAPAKLEKPAAGPHVGLHVLLGGPAHVSTHEGPPALQWSWPVFAGCGPSSALVGRALLANACMQSPCSFPTPQTLKQSPDTCLVKCSPCSVPLSYCSPPPSHSGPASQLTPVPAARVPELENPENGF